MTFNPAILKIYNATWQIWRLFYSRNHSTCWSPLSCVFKKIGKVCRRSISRWICFNSLWFEISWVVFTYWWTYACCWNQLELADLPYYGTVEELNSNNPLHFKSFNDKHKEQLWYLDAGSCDEGGFDESVREISKVFQKHGINFESHIFEGHHNLEYIKQNIRNYLIFYGAVDK